MLTKIKQDICAKSLLETHELKVTENLKKERISCLVCQGETKCMCILCRNPFALSALSHAESVIVDLAKIATIV